MSTENPVLRKRALFQALGYEPHPGQLLVHRSRAPRRVLACGVRFGKSFCAAYEAIAAMMEPRERSLGWCVSPTYNLTDRVFRLIVQIAQSHLSHRIRSLSERDQRITMTNFGGGVSEVRGKSADRPASLLGEALDWVVVDEAAELDREVWDEYLSQRLIDRCGWALLISTPKGPGWFLRMYRRGQKGRDAEFESWSMPSTTNPHIDAAAIEGERARLPEETFRQEYLGEFIRSNTEPCDRCGGPKRGAPGLIIVEGEAEVPCCPDCDRPVDENGKTVVALWDDGSVHLTILRESGIDWVFGVPDQLLSPEVLAKDQAAQLGPSAKVIYELTPDEITLGKAGVPPQQWPSMQPETPPEPKVEIKKFVPGPLNGARYLDD